MFLRFDLQELEQLCRLRQNAEDDVLHTNQEENATDQTEQAFMELLRSMWSGEEEEEATNSDGGGRREETERSDEVTAGDRELGEERVNEEELEEIYEFAATQKQKKERDEEEEDEKTDEDQRGDAAFTKLTEPPDGRGDKYNRLSSEPRGVYEGDRSSLTVRPKTPPLQSKHRCPRSSASKESSWMLLQSSESLVDLSVRTPLVTSNLPVIGRSPDQGGDQEDGGPTRRDVVGSKQESLVPRGVFIPPPDSSSKKEEPELIVLSDSSEDTEVGVAVLRPCSPAQNLQSYTELRSRPDAAPSEDKESSPDDPRDCSPEVSWLIPATPLQSDRTTRSGSSQTKSSMFRTRLFPKGASSAFFSPASSFNDLHASNKPQVPEFATESRVARQKPSASPPRSLGREACLKESDASPKRDVFAVSSSCFSRSTRYSLSKQESPPQLQHPPYSSTPSHAQPPVPPSCPLHTSPDKQKSPSQRGERASSEIMENTELGSDPRSSSSSSDLHQSEGRTESSSPSHGPAERRDGPTKIGARHEQEEEEEEGCNDNGAEEAGAAGSGELCFQQSFVDEPPIAFNDSWALDVYAETDPGRFSLRLEDSGGSNLQGDTWRRQTSRTLSSSTSSPTLNDRVQMNAKRGGATSSPPPCHPPPPEPNTRSTEGDSGALDSKLWDSWEEDDEVESLPLSQRVTVQLKTPGKKFNLNYNTHPPFLLP